MTALEIAGQVLDGRCQPGIVDRSHQATVLHGVVPQGDIVVDRAAEQADVLIDRGDDVGQPFAAPGAQAVTIDQDLAGLRLEQAGDELAQRGLAAARFSDQRHPLARRHLEREILDQRRPGAL